MGRHLGGSNTTAADRQRVYDRSMARTYGAARDWKPERPGVLTIMPADGSATVTITDAHSRREIAAVMGKRRNAPTRKTKAARAYDRALAANQPKRNPDATAGQRARAAAVARALRPQSKAAARKAIALVMSGGEARGWSVKGERDGVRVFEASGGSRGDQLAPQPPAKPRGMPAAVVVLDPGKAAREAKAAYSRGPVPVLTNPVTGKTYSAPIARQLAGTGRKGVSWATPKQWARAGYAVIAGRAVSVTYKRGEYERDYALVNSADVVPA